MYSFSQLIAPAIAASVVLYGFYSFIRYLSDTIFFSPLRKFSGPPKEQAAFVFGHIKVLGASTGGPSVLSVVERWFESYGPSFKYKGFFCYDQLITKDTTAIQHILTHEQIYQKPVPGRFLVRGIIGDGVVLAEGAKHRLQRKVMNPAFGPGQIRELTEIFTEKSVQLRDMWVTQIKKQNGTAVLDAYTWLSKATLDVIGLAGFHYNFNALNDQGHVNELDKAFSTLFRSDRGLADPRRFIQANVPLLRMFPSFLSNAGKEAKKAMDRLGNEFLQSSKAYHTGTGEKAEDLCARDLLSLLVKSNMNKELPGHQRMMDEDVTSQVPTFIVAGHETTSTSTTWALYALAEHKDTQTRLREEVLSVPTDTPTMDELSNLPYLDKVVRETLRLCSPVAGVNRCAIKDDVLPLSRPIIDSDGKVHHEIFIEKGQSIMVSVLGVNRDKSLWGEDALEFKPERWEKVPEAVSSIPGVWGHILTFIGGPRACIGWRFSVVEMKALLFALVRSFEFELAIPAEDLVVKRDAPVQRPLYKSGDKSLTQLPLRVKLVDFSV